MTPARALHRISEGTRARAKRYPPALTIISAMTS